MLLMVMASHQRHSLLECMVKADDGDGDNVDVGKLPVPIVVKADNGVYGDNDHDKSPVPIVVVVFTKLTTTRDNPTPHLPGIVKECNHILVQCKRD